KEQIQNTDSKPHSIWEGELEVNRMKLRVVLKINIDKDGNFTATLDSPDQGAKDIPVSKIILTEDSLNFEIQIITGYYMGSLNDGKDSAVGTWTQSGNTRDLTLKKVEEVTEIKRPQEPKPPYPYFEEEVSYENKEAGITIGGTL